MDDFQKRGQALIAELKEHVLKTLSRDARGSSDGPGLSAIEIERLCGFRNSTGSRVREKTGALDNLDHTPASRC
jgi:hypothetical protein